MKIIISYAFNKEFNEETKEEFLNLIYNKSKENFQASEWENMLTSGLRILYPDYIIERVGNINEKEHGTDIIVRIPGILKEDKYIIAIQIKDYSGIIKNKEKIIGQIKKAENGWKEEGKLIEKILLITSAEREKNEELNELCEKNEIKIIYTEDLKDILYNIGMKHIGLIEE